MFTINVQFSLSPESAELLRQIVPDGRPAQDMPNEMCNCAAHQDLKTFIKETVVEFLEGLKKHVEPEKTSGRTRRTASQAPAKPAASPAPEKTSGTAKKVVTDKNIKQIVDWVCQVPEGPNRDERVKKAEASYEWPGNLLETFRAMVDLSE